MKVVKIYKKDWFLSEALKVCEELNLKKSKGFFLRAFKPHKAKIKLNLLDY